VLLSYTGSDGVCYVPQQDWTMRSVHNSDSIAKGSRHQMLDLLENTYRVLLTRGLKGCYIFFEDKETADYVRSRMER
jgi:DUF2075 family protein